MLTTPTKGPGMREDMDRCIEMVARLLKYSMRILENEFAEFLENLFENAKKAFEKYPICTYLYLV